MRKFVERLAFIAVLVALTSMGVIAQDYRARVQGSVFDESKGVMPGVTVTLINEATGVKSDRVTDDKGRYLFDFVDPGMYSITAELDGFKKAEQKNVRVSQRGDSTVDLTLVVGGLSETVTVEAAPVVVQFNSSSSDITLSRQLIDQAPISGRNPYNLANLDPTIAPATASSGAAENRPYHHAYANNYDAGGATTNANDVLLDGVALGASYKTAYTPAVDAVEEITVSKNSVDAENGHSLGGVISLNMKSGTNQWKGSLYGFMRDPSLNSIADPTIKIPANANLDAYKGTELKTYGATLGFPIKKNKLFSFTSYEQWDDSRPNTIVRTVPTAAERAGDFSQSALNGVVRTIYNPWTSTLDSAGKVVRQAFAGNVIPSTMIDPVALKLLQQIPLPNVAGNIDNLQYSVYDKTDYWNFSQRLDLNITDNWKIFARYGQFKANLYQQNPTDSGYFPLTGSNRYGMSAAADSVWVMSNRMTLNIRGSYYNMTDEFYNPSLLLGDKGLQGYWANNWYSSLYNSGYVYYPALDVTSGTGTNANNRLGRQGREWYQHPDAWTAAVRLNRYQGAHNFKVGGESRGYYGEAARFEPINLVFNSTLTANSSDSPAVTTSGNQWATFLLGALDNQTSARLVPLQTPRLLGYAAYVQDDWKVNDRLTINVGLRWEYEPAPWDPEYRLSQRLDLSQPIPEMAATPPSMPQQALDLMASKGYRYTYNGAWVFTSKDNKHAWDATWKNFLPRFGANYRLGENSVIRFGYARFMRPMSNVRDTLGDFVNQYAGYAQTTTTLGLAAGVPRQVLADPFPAGVNPVIEPYGQAYGRYTNLGGAVSLDQYELRPQINDRMNLSYQRQILFGTILDLSYFFNYGTRVPYSIDLNMMDPAYRYEYKTLLNTQVTNPFRNYLTVDKFPGALRNTSTVTLGSLLKPYPQYTSITQTNTNGSKMKTHSFEVKLQRPFSHGFTFLAAYAYNHERVQNWYDDIAQYKVLTSGGKDGWSWVPTATPVHRMTAAATWQIPVGRERAIGRDMSALLDLFVGGWQYTVSSRYYSGRPLLWGSSMLVSGNPKLDKPTNDRWFDTSMFSVADTYTPRSNPYYFDGLNGPSAFFTDMTLTKNFNITGKYKLEARIEAYNAFNSIIWDNPDMTLGSANFGKVTRKRAESTGREIQVGLRFVF